ncbi:hypothetical protein CPJCM30710_27890 [Clostridium polyendosporum]|uniref:DOD-type homing endonuclease domain-containing protein n=1 Tax=Clostridium polyendosporum TaxID=69208 RepID=A0A919VN11_9CLOT|nr:LAGLIDADG family homing endonuclease [Clostridium polyendosporum]GIM30123.1 hypothetical protein CPJCM30710_27890 [Clostridium polyendosporum]
MKENMIPICHTLTKEKLAHLRKTHEIKEIATMYDCSSTYVVKLINEYKLEKKIGWLQKKYPYEVIKYYYADLEMCAREIAQELGEKQKRIAYLITTYNLGRDTSTANYLRNSKHSSVNVDFFKYESKEFWYIVGILLTDGCIKDNGTITLGLSNKETIDWIVRTIDYKNKIYVIKPNSKGNGIVKGRAVKQKSIHYEIAFRNHEVAKILQNYGLVPRKTKILRSPYVPDKFLGDFLRGVLDGDGTIPVWEIKRLYGGIISHNGNFTVSVASKDFAYGIKECVERLIGGDRKVHEKEVKGYSTMYYYSITLKEDLIALADKIYKDELFTMGYKRENFRILQNEGIILRVYKSSISEGDVTFEQVDYLYNFKRYTVKQLAEHFGKSHTCMLDIMESLNIKRRKKGSWRTREDYLIDFTSKEELIELYVEQKLSVPKIIELINKKNNKNFKVSALYFWLNKLEILPEFNEYHKKRK